MSIAISQICLGFNGLASGENPLNPKEFILSLTKDSGYFNLLNQLNPWFYYSMMLFNEHFTNAFPFPHDADARGSPLHLPAKKVKDGSFFNY